MISELLMVFCTAFLFKFNTVLCKKKYLPKWDSLDTRPLPEWYDEAKIGIFVHWGVYSVPAFRDEWFLYNWIRGAPEVIEFVHGTYGTNFTYQDLAPIFKPAKFDSDQWAQLFYDSGARYVVFTSKHHDGFAMFQSGRPNWNSVDTGPKRDIVGSLEESVKRYGMKYGIYYSLLEWTNEIYLKDVRTRGNTTEYVDNVILPDIKFLIDEYKPSILWADGDQDLLNDFEPSPKYWKSEDLIAWLYNESPVKNEVVVNDRWGKGTRCRRGDFYNCLDRYNPKVLMKHKWENAFSLDKYSWGFRDDMSAISVLSINSLIENVVTTVSCGGNALINVGPTKEGIIVEIFEKRLLQLGNWLTINGEAIYETKPWFSQNDSINSDVWYTCKDSTIYAIFLNWPVDDVLKIKDPVQYLTYENASIQIIVPDSENTSVKYNNNTKPTQDAENGYKILMHEISKENVLEVSLPEEGIDKNQPAWVLKIKVT